MGTRTVFNLNTSYMESKMRLAVLYIPAGDSCSFIAHSIKGFLELIEDNI